MAYNHSVLLSHLQSPDHVLVTEDYDLAANLELIGLPKRYHKEITGIVLVIGDGDIYAAWLTESSRPYDLDTLYNPLSYYRPRSWSNKR